MLLRIPPRATPPALPDAAPRPAVRGQAMVEFAMVILPLLVVVVGIIQFGLIFGANVSLTNAAREGAREATIFRYNASDGQAASSMVTVALTVDPVNDAPCLLAALPDQNRPARLPYSFAVSPYFADIDAGDVLTFSAQLADGSPLPAWLNIDAASGVLSGTPDNAAAGAYTLRISASDGLETIFDDFVLTVETNQFLLFIPMVLR